MNLRKIYILILALGIITLGACNKWIDEKINIDPDRPTMDEVSMDLVIPAIEARAAYNLGGFDIVGTSSIWTQQCSGVSMQAGAQQIYIYTANEGNNVWNSIYAGIMMDAIQVIDLSKKKGGSPHFRGVAKIMLAMTLGNTTDLWGDVPFSDAFQGIDNLAPKFDKQEDIYIKINDLLDEAIKDLRTSDEENFYPLEGDMIFENDTSKWIATAYTLKARYLLHLSKRNPSVYDEIAKFMDKGISDNNGDCKFEFSASPTGSNPMYQFDTQRKNQIRSSEVLVSLLREIRIPKGSTLEIPQDPRLTVYAHPVEADFTFKLSNPERDTTIKKGSYFGSLPGYSLSGASLVGPAVTNPESPVYFTSFVENELIKAEVYWKKGEFAKARTALVNAVTSSLQRNDVYSSDWVTKYEAAITPLAGDDLYKEIIIQRYLGLYFTLESFNDFRRTNNEIGLEPIPQNVLNNFPRRFIYTIDEISYNRNTPPSTLTEPVWWDKQ